MKITFYSSAENKAKNLLGITTDIFGIERGTHKSTILVLTTRKLNELRDIFYTLRIVSFNTQTDTNFYLIDISNEYFKC